MSIRIGIGRMQITSGGGGGGGNWDGYWASLISATVENAAPTHVVLTFPVAAATVAADITCTVNGAARVVNSASWTGAVWTVVLASAVVYGDVVVVTFVPSGGTANVTNNVAAEAELTTYITGLATPLSLGQRVKLNTFIKAVKTGVGIANLSDAFDVMVILAGETSESSLKNLVKNANHGTLAGVPVPSFTALEGFTSDATNGYINTNYNPTTHGVNYKLDDAGIGIYIRTSTASKSCGGNGAAGVHPTRLNPQAEGNKMYAYVNGYGHCDVVGVANVGFISGYRDTATTSHSHHNKTSATVNNNRSGLVNATLFMLADSNNGVPFSFWTAQKSLYYFSKNLSTAQHDSLVDAFEAYMDANGKGVI